MPIAQRTAGIVQNKKTPDQPCKCGSGVFWLDPYRGFHCSACDPPPNRKMVKENLVLVPGGEAGQWNIFSATNETIERRRKAAQESPAGPSESLEDRFGRRADVDFDEWLQAGYEALLAMERAASR